MAKEKLAKEKSFTTIALVGEETLLGRELKEVLESRAPHLEIDAYAANGEGNFSEREGETIYIRPLEAAAVLDQGAIVLAGSAEGASKAYELARQNGGQSLVIDCVGHLESKPEALLAAPLLEEPKLQGQWLLVLAHPAAAALALVLIRVAKYRPIRTVVANIFEPASERGKKGLTELHQQTTSLLSFKALDKDVFDAQLAFNLLARYGEEAPVSLASIEQRIERDVATLLSRTTNSLTVPLPSVRLSQASVFHGYSFSLWIEFESEVRAEEIEEALASAQIEIRRSDEEAPNNAAAASQSGLIAGDIRIDRNNPRAAWLWVVADNLRLIADGATDILRNLLADTK